MITVNTTDIFPSDNCVHIGLSNGKKYKILLKDYENLPFECKENSLLDDERIDSVIFLSRKYSVYKSAISKIALTDIPKKQLYQKLYFSYKQYLKNEIESETLKTLCALVCDEFESSGYIDDRRYAFDKARYLKEYKKYGNNKIKEYLYQKGIPSDIISETLEDEFFAGGDGNLENMQNLLKKKFGENLNRLDKSDRNDIQKAINMLIRNGYKYQEAKNAVFDLIEDENIDFRYSAEDEDYENE